MAQIRLENVVKRFGKVTAVDRLDLCLEDKEFVVLLGPSGCGKSTALRMIAGLEEVTEGRIFIDGKPVNHVEPKDRDIAMVFQNYALYPHMNVYDNMAFALKLRKLTKSEIDRRVQDAAGILGLRDLLRRKPRELSGGQSQRVAMGRAIVRKPVAFLFDEPLSNLDAKLRASMRREIRSLHDRLQTTTVYVTHDQVEAMTLADRVVVLKDGRMQQVGAPMAIYERPANTFVAGFIGHLPMNLMEGSVDRTGGVLRIRGEGFVFDVTAYAGAREILSRYERETVVVGIRPEDMADTPAREKPAGGTLRLTVSMVEPMGSSTHLRMDGDGREIIAAVHPGTGIRAGDTAELACDLAKVCLYDTGTGELLGRLV